MAAYVPLALCGRPTSQIHAPERLVNDLEVQHLELAADTKAEGNCGARPVVIDAPEYSERALA